MSDGGWVKNHRKIAEWEWYTTPHMAHIFQHLIRSASHIDTKWQGVDIKKGQVVVGLPSLSNATGVSSQALRTCLTRLECSGEIVKKSTNRFTILTICKYCDYQQTEQTEQQASNRQATGKQQASNNIQEVKNERSKEVKEEKIKEEKKRDRFSPVSVKPDFISSELWQDVIEHRQSQKSTSTYKAYSILISEIEKAVRFGLSVESCVETMINKGWRGFKAEWMLNDVKRNGQKVYDRVTLKEQQAREMLYGSADRDSEKSYFDMEPDIPAESRGGTIGNPGGDVLQAHATVIQRRNIFNSG